MSVLLQTLLKENLITQKQLNDAKDKQLGAKRPIHELLVEMDFIKEEDLIRVMSEVFNVSVLNLEKEKIDSSVTKLISYEKAKRYGVFPVRKERNTLILAMSDSTDMVTLDDIKAITMMGVKPILATKSQINQYIKTYYHADDALYDLLKNISEESSAKVVKEDKLEEGMIDVKALKEDYSPVVKLLNFILSDAVKNRASDIHIEPQENVVLVRYRVDGDLRNIIKFPNKIFRALVNRIKITGMLDIAERQKAQDGRVSIFVNERKIDLRISTMPTFYGEKVELRILDLKEAKTQLNKIGFEPKNLKSFTGAVSKPQGIVLVTGPTGSGKTSTIYAALNFIKEERKNIITIEDPIEYLIEGINQIQVNPIKNITFAAGLRSILRQDPDIILVGEIRDKETARMAFQSSLTGHLVFSTLHTKNSVGSITRLLDIGLEPFLISSSLILVVAQRLIKLICPHCKNEYEPDEKLINRYKIYIDNLDIRSFYKGKGCKKCNYTGYLGRTAIFELLEINEAIRELIANRSSEDLILKEAKKNGLKSLAESGMEKVAEGITSLDEVANVTEVLEIDEKLQRIKKPGAGTLILIADDDEDILKTLDKRLSDAGYNVIKVRDGEELLEHAVREKPDIIVTDITMPKMSGFEAMKQLKMNLETAMIPVIMLTARQDKQSELKGLNIGADDYITKPFDKDKLLARIRMLLRRSKEKNEDSQ